MDDDTSSTSTSSNPGSPGEAGFMAAVLVVMFICLFVGWKTPETVVFMCLVLAWNVGLVDTTEALSGFSNAGMLAVGALFVVIKGVEKSQLADKAARRVFGLRTSLSAGLARMMSLCFVLSAFLNNTPVVALLIPITRDWARARGFSPSIFLIPLSYSCIMGGLLTVIGTSTNLVVQGLVLDEQLVDPSIEAIGFFEPAYIGIPLGIVGMLYLVIFAPRVLPSRGGLFRYVRDRAKELLTEVQVMSDFPYKGEPAGLVLARLGLPQDTLIKIRRKLSPGILRQMSQSLEGNASLARPISSLYSTWSKEGTGAAPQQQQQQQQQQDVSAIMEANQKTFRAESMYSYRIRAESLWGTKDDLAQEEKTMSPVAAAAAANSNSGRASGKFSRKRWVSDTDASNLWGQKLQRPASTGASKSNGVSNGNGASATAAVADASKNGGGPIGGVADGETYTDIFPVSAAEPIQDGDVLFLSCAQATMIDFQAVTVSQRLKGLKFLDVSALDLPGHGTEFFEIVLSGHNHFVGRSASRDNAEFAAYYNVSVVAVRRRGQSEAMNNTASVVSAPPSSSVHMTGSFRSRPGPAAAAAAAMDHPEVFIEEGVEPALNPNSRAVSPSGSVPASSALSPPPPPASANLPLPPPRSDILSGSRGRGLGLGLSGVLPRSPMIRGSRKGTFAQEDENAVTESSFKAGDVVLVLAKEEFMEKYGASKDFFLLTKVGSVPKPVRYFDYLPLLAFLGMLIWVLLDADMVQAAFTVGAILIFGGWVDAKKTVSYVDWSLLLLIGSALGLSKGIVNSGLADYVGGAIRDSGISADASLFVLYAFTMTCTELITNNAAAALATPIAFSISRELGVSYKPFILTVMLAASSSFITPIGYQTNTLVWGPGGYKFTDFMKIGTPLSLIYLVLGCLLVPRIFPF